MKFGSSPFVMHLWDDKVPLYKKKVIASSLWTGKGSWIRHVQRSRIVVLLKKNRHSIVKERGRVREAPAFLMPAWTIENYLEVNINANQTNQAFCWDHHIISVKRDTPLIQDTHQEDWVWYIRRRQSPILKSGQKTPLSINPEHTPGFRPGSQMGWFLQNFM